MDPHAETQETRSTKRLRILARIACVWGLLILLRLFELQILDHQEYSRLADGQQRREVEINAARGEIFDRNGERLALSLPVDSVCVNPMRIKDLSLAAEVLARVLDIDGEELLRRMASAQDAGRGFVWVKRKITPEESERLRSLNMEWVEFRRESRRFYPKGPLAASVIGGVDHQEKGNAGIEQTLNEDLQGRPGVMRTTADVRGGVIERVVFTDPQPGKTMKLSLDERIQFVAERELRSALELNHCTTGSLVVMNPNTGEVLAIANALAGHEPFNPNEPVLPGEPIENRANLAITAPFEPGSVFKVITLAAALETTDVRPRTIIPCGNGRITLFRRVIHDHDPYSALSMADVLAKSSNIGAIQIGLKVGDQRMYEYMKAFGFGRSTGLPLPGESSGLIWPLKKWIPSSIGSIAMGHELLTTTVQLAQACSALANGGLLVRPKLVLEKRMADGQVEAVKSEEPTRVLKPETAATMRTMMQGVVLAGTGRKAQVQGYSTAGKTGSAQIYDHATRTYSHKYNASFMGFAPVNRPAIVIVVTLNGASKYGGAVAAPVFERVAKAALRFLDVPKDLPDEPLPPVEDEPGSDLAIAELGAEHVSEEEFATAYATGAIAVRNAVLKTEPVKPVIEALPARVFGPEPPSPVVVLRAVEAGPKVPIFVGKTMRTVLEESTEAGIVVETKGAGIARMQDPPPGAVLRTGERVRVLFAR